MKLDLPIRLLLILLLANLVACTKTDSEQANTLAIGLIAPLTGEVAKVGQSSVEAAQLVVAEINAKGGLQVGPQHYQLELFIEDNQDSPHHAVHVARKLISQHKVIAIIGPQLSRNAIPVAKLVEQYQVPMISPWSSNPETTAKKQFVFRVTTTDDVVGRSMARFAYEELGIRHAAVLFDIASPYNYGLAEFFRLAFKKHGGKIVAYESYTTDNHDYRLPLQRIKNAQPSVEALFLPNYGYEVIKQAAEARGMGIDAILLGSSSWITIAPQNKANLDNSYFISEWNAETDNPKAQQLIQDYQAAHEKPVEDIIALTYDAFHLLFKAIELQQSTEAKAITDTLRHLCYEGVNGLICYQGTGNPVKSVNVMQINANKITFYQQIATAIEP